jgi:hypothetical protein
MYNINDLKAEVTLELFRLKDNASDNEKKRLNFKTFDPSTGVGCIYGQLTGDSSSQRAKELLCACAKPFSKWISIYAPPKANVFKISARDYSPVEFYIVQHPQTNEQIIAYLKGGSNKITL